MFKIVHGSPYVNWFPIKHAVTCYIGQIVKFNGAEGVEAIGAEGGAIPSTAHAFGIIVGFNVGPGYETFNTTYNAQYLAGITATNTAAQAAVLARQPFFTGGRFPKSTRLPMAKGAILDRTQVIEGPICYSALTTAPQVVTCTTADTTYPGVSGMVHSALTVATVAYNNMYYCRTGANAGDQRPSYAAHQTTPTFYNAWENSWAVSDTFAVSNVGLGSQYLQFDTASMWVEAAAPLTSYGFAADVISLDLRTASKETIQFRLVV